MKTNELSQLAPAPTMLDAAIEYAQRGWPVLPLHTPTSGRKCSCRRQSCESAGKHPRTAHGVKDATLDEKRIRRWWTTWPDANIGIRTGSVSQLVVLDADDPVLVSFIENVEALDTLVVSTARGKHFYCKHPGGSVRPAKLIPGLDLRADDSYVVAPPSLHASGRRYEFVDRHKSIAPLPDLSTFDVSRAGPSRADGSFAAGERNTRLASIGGSLARHGIKDESLEAILTTVNSAACIPPLDPDEVRGIAKSVGQYAESPRIAQGAPPRVEVGSWNPSAPVLFNLLTVEELLTQPAQDWLIEGLIESASLGLLYGPSGSGKSFAALDWSLSIASDRAWCGHKVRQGPVVYVAGEGTSGVVRRVRAWMAYHALPAVPDAFFLLAAPLMLDPSHVSALTSAILTKSQPALIVLDTLARCFVGGDENSAKEMGVFVENCRRLQTTTGATVLVVHHTGKPKNNKAPSLERGSSALRAAADVVIGVTKTQNLITISNDKQKDDEECAPIRARLERIALGTDDLTGRPLTSCVLVPITEGLPTPELTTRLNTSEHMALEVLAALGEASSGHWRAEIATSRKQGVSDRTFQNWRTKLLAERLVAETGDGTHVYRLTSEGAAALLDAKAAKLLPLATPSGPTDASHATPPIGGGTVAEGDLVTRQTGVAGNSEDGDAVH